MTFINNLAILILLFFLNTMTLYALGNNKNIHINLYTGNPFFIFDKIKLNENKQIEYIKNHPFLLNKRDKRNGKTLLHYAIVYKRYKLLRYLINHNINTNIRDYNGDTPLHLAVKNNDLYAVELIMLLSKSFISLSIKNSNGLTPLDIARANKNKQIMQYFKEIYDDLSQEQKWVKEQNQSNGEIKSNEMQYDDFDMNIADGAKDAKDIFQKVRHRTYIKHHKIYEKSYIKSKHEIKASKNTGNADVQIDISK